MDSFNIFSVVERILFLLIKAFSLSVVIFLPLFGLSVTSMASGFQEAELEAAPLWTFSEALGIK